MPHAERCSILLLFPEAQLNWRKLISVKTYGPSSTHGNPRNGWLYRRYPDLLNHKWHTLTRLPAAEIELLNHQMVDATPKWWPVEGQSMRKRPDEWCQDESFSSLLLLPDDRSGSVCVCVFLRSFWPNASEHVYYQRLRDINFVIIKMAQYWWSSVHLYGSIDHRLIIFIHI